MFSVSFVNRSSYSLESIAISSNSPYASKSIWEINLGDQYGGLVVGIEKGESRILNPESNVILEAVDLVWIFGHRDKIRQI